MHCKTLYEFLNKIEKSHTERERTALAIEASEISDKIIHLIPTGNFRKEVERHVEYISYMVFSDDIEPAYESINRVFAIVCNGSLL